MTPKRIETEAGPFVVVPYHEDAARYTMPKTLGVNDAVVDLIEAAFAWRDSAWSTNSCVELMRKIDALRVIKSAARGEGETK